MWAEGGSALTVISCVRLTPTPYDAALALAPHLPKSFFKNYMIYVPIPGTQSCYPKCGPPRNSSAITRSPSRGLSLLFGTGLVVLAGTVRRKLARS
jgi:hypothetical protein